MELISQNNSPQLNLVCISEQLLKCTELQNIKFEIPSAKIAADDAAQALKYIRTMTSLKKLSLSITIDFANSCLDNFYQILERIEKAIADSSLIIYPINHAQPFHDTLCCKFFPTFPM